MQENRLIRHLQRKNPKALQALMTEYGAYVGTIIRNITRTALTEADVEELTADTFFAVWQTAEKLECGKVRAYLAAIARNKAKSRLRGQKVLLPLEEDMLLLSDWDLEQDVEQTLLTELLHDLMQLLSESDREILIRYYYYYQKLSEIAAETELTENNVKVRLHRTRKKLKQLLIERGYSYETESL